MTWAQSYNPAGNIYLSALLAALPVVVLLGLLSFAHVKAHWAALTGLASALLLAILFYRMPIMLALAAAGNGAAFGLFPIGWLVLNAIFIYDITVTTGSFEVAKQTIAGLASDRRIQALFIAFSFGAFIEGAAGFGAPVAISAAMLLGLGFRPIHAAGLALIGNTAPVAFGSLGIPLVTLAKVTGLDLGQLSAMVGRQLPFFSILIPFWLIAAMSGWRAMWEVWPACLVVGGTFALSQFLVSNYHGPWLVDTISAIVSMLALSLLLRFWQPRTTWRFEHEAEHTADKDSTGLVATRRETQRAWMPWVILSVLVFLWSLQPVKDALNNVSNINISVPYLDKGVVRVPPVVPKPKAEDAIFALNWLSATGTALLLTGILSGLLLGLRPLALLRLYGQTLLRVRWSLLTIATMLALGFTTRFSGSDTTMGLALAGTGVLFPFFSPLLGWLGTALTGSDTSSNVLFGNLQQVTAHQIGVSPILTAAANSSGGVMGKMIDVQSIVVAGVATEQQGDEGEILRYVFFHSIALAVMVGILVLLQAHVFPSMVPHAAMR
ncbi:MAG: lactate permease LctP family transporter [Abitibacteriaceae bacterium]|nr:lactate permease LctP family transporter [Abditibacteriaceae bacterium]